MKTVQLRNKSEKNFLTTKFKINLRKSSIDLNK